MTDIREKVARAINKADDEIEHFGTDAEINAALLKLADAALLACGYEKMREALELAFGHWDECIDHGAYCNRAAYNHVKAVVYALGEDKT